MSNNSDYKYWAFISYSHADDKWARWLHKALETYRIPKALIGQDSRDEAIPARLFPVFRDRDELPTSSELGEVINDALRKSRYIIVICSRAAAKSVWVSAEIRYFKSLGRENRVLCLIVDGEPNASDIVGRAEEECFPEPIRYQVNSDQCITQKRTEPVAADMRAGKDGKNSCKLKLIAGLLGVSFDSLKQRDQQRSLRRMKILSSVALLLLCVFVGLGVALYFQRESAIKNFENYKIEERARKELSEKMEKEAYRSWKVVSEDAFDSEASFGNWKFGYGLNEFEASISKEESSSFVQFNDGAMEILPRKKNVYIVTQKPYAGDLRVECQWQPLGEKGAVELALNGGTLWYKGYNFRLDWNTHKASITRHEPPASTLIEAPFTFTSGQIYQLDASVERVDDKAVLKLLIDGKQVLVAEDEKPLALGGFYRGGALIVTREARCRFYHSRFSMHGLPIKEDLLTVAKRHFTKGNYEVAKGLFEEITLLNDDSHIREEAEHYFELSKDICTIMGSEKRITEYYHASDPNIKILFNYGGEGSIVIFREGTKNVKDIAILEGLPIQYLNIARTQVSDLTPVKGMKLVALYAEGCPIKDLSPLAGQVKTLKELIIPSTQVSDLSPIHGFKLNYLVIYETQVKDLSALENMSSLKGINIANTSVSSLEPLKSMKIETLTANNTNITDITSLENMPLRDLFINTTKIKDYASLSKLTELRRLHLSGSDMTSLSHLNAPELIILVLLNTHINDFSFMKSLKNLQIFISTDTHLDSVEPLRNLPLARCHIAGDNLTTIEAFRDMSLHQLSLFYTQVRDISVVRDMPLVELNLLGLHLDDLSPLKNKNIVVLDLTHTTIPIESVDCLATLPLKSIFIGGSNLEDLSFLKGKHLNEMSLNPSLNFLSDIYFGDTSITDKNALFENSFAYDLSTLKDTEVENIAIDLKHLKAGWQASLKSMTTLKVIATNVQEWKKRQTPEQFWANYEAGKYNEKEIEKQTKL